MRRLESCLGEMFVHSQETSRELSLALRLQTYSLTVQQVHAGFSAILAFLALNATQLPYLGVSSPFFGSIQYL